MQSMRKDDNPLRGIALMLFAMMAFSGTDVISKWLAGQGYSPFEIAFARYAVLALALLPALIRSRGGVLRSARPRLQSLRGLFMAGTTSFFIFGLAGLPLADATAIGFASPLMATALSVPVLKERVGGRRWAGVAVGFLGIVIAMRPGAASFDSAAFMPLGSAVCWAAGLIVTRLMKASESPVTTLAYTALVASSALLLPVLYVWKTPTLPDLAMALVMGGITALAQWTLILALHNAPPSVVAPFAYSQIVWATLFGAIVFGVIPDLATWSGAGIVVACGLYLLHRERMELRTHAGRPMN